MTDDNDTDSKDAKRRAYHRQYYHEKKTPEQCPHCERMFSSRSALLRHTRRNMKCALQRTTAELKEMKENLN
jgi:uncharacterized C2H2 Zn-finger protein